MNITQYQSFIMWKATNPKDRSPLSLSAYIDKQNVSFDEVQSFMNHDNYGKDLAKATRFLINNELPDLIWSIYEQVKLKKKGADLESLMKIIQPKKSEDSGGIFSAFDESLTPEQKKQILSRLDKK